MPKDTMDSELKAAVDKVTGMADMKRSKAEIKEEKERWKECSPGDSDVYPYGLELRLENYSLDKLGIGELPRVGDRMRIEAIAVVEEARSSEVLGKDGKPKPAQRNLTLQVQKMAVTKTKKS